MQQIAPAAELLVWDSVGEWTRANRCVGLRSLADVHHWVLEGVVHGYHRAAAAGYFGPGSRAHFETFCRLAWVWMRAGRGRVLVIEELADVTSPGKAPAAWGEIVRKGRHAGGRVYALTQRPAESDKTIAGNADVIHAGRQSFPRDRKSMADYLDVPESDVIALGSLDWLERDMRTRELTRGRVKF
jgi:hypothetical protein